MKNGKGREDYFKNEDIKYYQGEYEFDSWNGSGFLFFKNQDYYKGNFVQGIRTGFGQFFSCSKNFIYEGAFTNNKFHGLGKMSDYKGVLYEGNWQYGK